jgi:RecJ-like exonuclease
MSTNYPKGTSPNDNTAPWNQDPTEPPECHHCGGTGYESDEQEQAATVSRSEGVAEHEIEKCFKCKGRGEVAQHDDT